MAVRRQGMPLPPSPAEATPHAPAPSPAVFVRPVYAPGLAAGILGGMLQGQDGAAAIAALPSEGSEGYIFTEGSSHVPAFVATAGVLIAVVTALNLCRPAPAPKTANTRPQLCAGTVLLAVCWLSAFVALRVGLHGYRGSTTAAEAAAAAAVRVQADLDMMNHTAATLEHDLRSVAESCHGLSELIRRAMGGPGLLALERLQAGAAKELLGYRNVVAHLQPSVGVIASLTSDASLRLAMWPSFLLYCFLAPVKLAAVTAIALLAAHVALGLGGSTAASVQFIGFGRLAAVMAAVTVCSASFAAAALLGLGTKAGGFCGDPDMAALELAGSTAAIMGAEQFAVNVGRFYMFGEGQNPILIDLVEARARSETLSTIITDSAKLLDTVALLCPAVDKHALNGTALSLREMAERDLMLLNERAMFERYNQAVYVGFCGPSMEALGWLVTCQTVVGLCCLPLVAALARPFVGQGALPGGASALGAGADEALLEAIRLPSRGGASSRQEPSGPGRAISFPLLVPEGAGDAPDLALAARMGENSVAPAAAGRAEEEKNEELMGSLLQYGNSLFVGRLGANGRSSGGGAGVGAPVTTAFGSAPPRMSGGDDEARPSARPASSGEAAATQAQGVSPAQRPGRLALPGRGPKLAQGQQATASSTAPRAGLDEDPQLQDFVPKRREEVGSRADRKAKFDERIRDVAGGAAAGPGHSPGVSHGPGSSMAPGAAAGAGSGPGVAQVPAAAADTGTPPWAGKWWPRADA